MKKQLCIMIFIMMCGLSLHASSKNALKILGGLTVSGVWGAHKVIEERIERERVIFYRKALQPLHAHVKNAYGDIHDFKEFDHSNKLWWQIDRKQEDTQLACARKDILTVLDRLDGESAARLAIDFAVVETRNPHAFGRSVTGNDNDSMSSGFSTACILAMKLNPKLDDRSVEV